MMLEVGRRSPLATPIGTCMPAWARDGVVEQWLDRADPALSVRARRQVVGALELVRSRGWSVTVRTPKRSVPFREALDDDFDAPEVDAIGIGAPVFGSGGARWSARSQSSGPRLEGREGAGARGRGRSRRRVASRRWSTGPSSVCPTRRRALTFA